MQRATTGTKVTVRVTTGMEVKKNLSDDGYRVGNDGYWIGRPPTTGRGRARTAEIARPRITSRATTGPTPRGRIASTVYKGAKLVRDSRSD